MVRGSDAGRLMCDAPNWAPSSSAAQDLNNWTKRSQETVVRNDPDRARSDAFNPRSSSHTIHSASEEVWAGLYTPRARDFQYRTY